MSHRSSSSSHEGSPFQQLQWNGIWRKKKKGSVKRQNANVDDKNTIKPERNGNGKANNIE